jgi:hypothetical protein
MLLRTPRQPGVDRVRPVKDWEEGDLDDLVRGQITESLRLKYKDSRALGNHPNQRSEIFKDISALANSAGGIIIYGIATTR